MKRIMFLAAMLALVSLTSAYAAGPAPLKPKHRPAGEKVSPELVAKLVEKLGSTDYEAREAATKKLTALGAGAKELLDAAAKETRDPEIRWRIKKILRSIDSSSGAGEARPKKDVPRRVDPVRTVPRIRIDASFVQTPKQELETLKKKLDEIRKFVDGGETGKALESLKAEIEKIARALREVEKKFKGQSGVSRLPRAVRRAPDFHKRRLDEKRRPQTFKHYHSRLLNDPKFGFILKAPGEEIKSQLGITGGSMVYNVRKGTRAEETGLERYDVILEVNGDSAATIPDFVKLFNAIPEGGAVKLTVVRSGKKTALEFKRSGLDVREIVRKPRGPVERKYTRPGEKEDEKDGPGEKDDGLKEKPNPKKNGKKRNERWF